MNRLTFFIAGLLGTFMLPWLFLIVLPHQSLRSLAPVVYSAADQDAGITDAEFPPGREGLVSEGARVYGAQGCVYCHTQMARPSYLGNDLWRTGWGGRIGDDQDPDNPVPMREPVPSDYLGEKYAYLGIQRLGPDLSNVGWRIQDENWHYQHLYSPQSLNPGSLMPPYKNLFEESTSGAGIDLPEKYAPENGAKVVPTAEARALVSYLMSMKKDYRIPADGWKPGKDKKD